jgi:hypothetical protein
VQKQEDEEEEEDMKQEESKRAMQNLSNYLYTTIPSSLQSPLLLSSTFH